MSFEEEWVSLYQLPMNGECCGRVVDAETYLELGGVCPSCSKHIKQIYANNGTYKDVLQFCDSERKRLIQKVSV